MTKFRKKPIVIDAFKFGFDNLPDWFMDKVTANEITLHTNGIAFQQASDGHCLIRTLEGEMQGNWGDFIIKGVQGEIYPCKSSIFDATYERV